MKRTLLLSTLIYILCVQYSVAQEFLHIGEHVIPLSNIKKITSCVRVHPKSLSILLEKDKNISIYVSALKATGMMDSLEYCLDDSYRILNVEDSCRWKNGNFYDYWEKVVYPEERRFNFTFFACPDTILYAKYNIKDLDGLRAKAKELYSPVYPEDATVTDETDRRNYLNRFISYQMLNFYGSKYKLTPNYDRWIDINYGGRFEVTEWYETMMPYSIIKFSSNIPGRLTSINRVNNSTEIPGVECRNHPPYIETEAVNGCYHYIDDVVAYDKITQKVVLNERIRIDFLALSPDFMTKGVDGETVRGYDNRDNVLNRDGGFGFKPGYVRNFEFDDSTKIVLSHRHDSWYCYQGDEFMLTGSFDITVKLPSVPAGKYELRLGSSLFTQRPRVAIYIDDEPIDIVDLKAGYGETYSNNNPLIDWERDNDGNPEIAVDSDRRMRNKGYMKGPGGYFINRGTTPLRDISSCVRKIIGTFDTDGKSDHYLRIKTISANPNSECVLDYIELVPSTIYDNDEFLEDIY